MSVMAGGDCVAPGVAADVRSSETAVAQSPAEPSPELQARAEEKAKFVQELIRNLEAAVRKAHEPEEKRYLAQIINPNDPCFSTLINLMVLPKYAGFVALRCVVLRAVQMILKVAVSTLQLQDPSKTADSNVGSKVLHELLQQSPGLAEQALSELCVMVDKTEQALVACDALLVLAELGPEAFVANGGSRVVRLLELFAALPDRASELVEVALRAHAWSGPTRSDLCEGAVTHDGGRYLGEVLLQTVNRGDRPRKIRAVKLYTGCFMKPNGANFLYTNDKRVLVEILIRELPTYRDPSEFICYADCYKALTSQCEVARAHLHQDAIQLFTDLHENDQSPYEVREQCAEVLAFLRSSPSC
jgi:hypothetical protein